MTIGPNSVGLSWTAPISGGAPTYGYTIVSRVTGTGPFSIVAAGLTGTNYEVTGLSPSTSFDFAVFAVNANGPGPMSAIITQATQGAVPNVPTGLTASAGSPAYSAVALSWTAPAPGGLYGPATSYIVQYRVHGSGSWTTAGSGVTGISYAVTGLSHDTAYDFQVLGVNSVGTGAASSAVMLTTDYAPPNVPPISSVAPVNYVEADGYMDGAGNRCDARRGDWLQPAIQRPWRWVLDGRCRRNESMHHHWIVRWHVL